jgi:hypothetical protein
VLITLNLSSEYTGYITEGNSPMMQLLIWDLAPLEATTDAKIKRTFLFPHRECTIITDSWIRSLAIFVTKNLDLCDMSTWPHIWFVTNYMLFSKQQIQLCPQQGVYEMWNMRNIPDVAIF